MTHRRESQFRLDKFVNIAESFLQGCIDLPIHLAKLNALLFLQYSGDTI